MRTSSPSRAILTLLFIAASFAFVGSAAGVTAEFAPSKDNTLIETPVGNSNGAGDGIYAGRVGLFGGGTARRGLLAFNLTSIPAGSTINSATLRLRLAQAPSTAAVTLSLHRVSADWGEAGSIGSGTGAAALPGDATWLFRVFDTQAWALAGGDFEAAASASQSVADTGSFDWTSTGMAADVQAWVDNGASNFGWLLKGDESTTSTVKKFYSGEGVTPPQLTVVYTASTDVTPGPSADAVWFAPPWPAPARGTVNLSYTLPRPAAVSLAIFDTQGRLVRHLGSHVAEVAGRHATVWNGRTESGEQAAPGVYLASLVVGADTYQRRISLLR